MSSNVEIYLANTLPRRIRNKVVKVFNNTNKEFGYSRTPGAFLKSLTSPFCLIFTYVQDKVLLGFLTCEVMCRSTEILELYVAPLHRRKRVGTSLYTRFEDVFKGIVTSKEEISPTVTLSTNELHLPFWECIGFGPSTLDDGVKVGRYDIHLSKSVDTTCTREEDR